MFLLFVPSEKELAEQPLTKKLTALTGMQLEDLVKVPLFNEMKNETDEALVKGNGAEALLKSPDRDDTEHSMEEVLKERELLFQNAEALFKEVKLPEGADHSHPAIEGDRVYIYHSHSRESFLPYFKYTDQPEDAFHPKVNITLAGKILERALEEKDLEYGSSYLVSRERVRSAQKANKDLDIFLDIHRDSLRQPSTTIEKNGETYARLLFVVGTGHAAFEQNLSFANELHEQISARTPGLSKGILTKDSSQGNGIYNQDLSPRSVIVEVGGVDNTAEVISRTIEVLADVLSDDYWDGK